MQIKKKNGFTLAELLIVVAIIGVLTAVAIPVFSSQLEKSREATDIANLRSAKAAAVSKYLADDLTEGTFYFDAQKGVLVSEDDFTADSITGYGKGTDKNGATINSFETSAIANGTITMSWVDTDGSSNEKADSYTSGIDVSNKIIKVTFGDGTTPGGGSGNPGGGSITSEQIYLAAYLDDTNDTSPTIVNITNTLASDNEVYINEIKNMLSNYYNYTPSGTSNFSLATTYGGNTQIGGGGTQIGGGSFSYPVYLNIYTNGNQSTPLKTVDIASNSALSDNQLTVKEVRTIVAANLDGDLSRASYQLYDDMWMPTSSISVDNTMGTVNIMVMVNGYTPVAATPDTTIVGLHYFSDINNPDDMFNSPEQDTISDVLGLANGSDLYIGVILENATKK